MDGSNPEHYVIADFLNWDDAKELVLNPSFQRGSVWLAPARSYLIDSILRGYPIPKLLLRTKIDRVTRKTIRDVVDGQQRLRTIIDFANNKLVLGTKAGEYRGLRFSDLDDEQKDSFLAYKLTCEQLINASDEDVLEVFVRINSYTVSVNEAELRNARYDNEFSSAVKETVLQVRPLWDLGVLAPRSRVRMLDQSLIAEIFGFFIEGVRDSDEKTLNVLYRRMNSREAPPVPPASEVTDLIYRTIDILADFSHQRIVQRPHFLMILATLGYLRGVIPHGRLAVTDFPGNSDAPINPEATQAELARLNDSLSNDTEQYDDYEAFVEASKSSTQRVRSRQIRFQYFYRALTVED